MNQPVEKKKEENFINARDEDLNIFGQSFEFQVDKDDQAEEDNKD